MDCLVTKLKGTVNDEELLKIDEFKIEKTVNSDWDNFSQTLLIKSSNSDIHLRIIGDGYFTNQAGTENNGKTYTISPTGNNETFYVSNGNFIIAVDNKYNITRLNLYTGGNEYPHSKNLVGGLEALRYMTSIRQLEVSGSSLYGDVEALSGLTNLVKVELGSTDVYGDISVFSGKALTTLLLMDSKVSGNLSSISGLTALVRLTVSSYVSGDLETLLNFPNLNVFRYNGANLTGDLFEVLSSKSINTFTISTGTYTYTTQNFSGKSYREFGGENLVINNLDNFLNDFQVISLASSVDGGGSAAIYVKGTRTSASDSAVSTLQGKGFTVTVPVATDAKSISTMSLDSGNYGIAYKDKELIVEPVDLTKMQIYPAKGVSVHKFDTLENAEKFIKDNGLVTSENE